MHIMKTKTTSDGHGALPRHLDDSDLISYLDGESTRDEQDYARAHLESCWHCRSQLASIETSIDAFLRVRRQILPDDTPPANIAMAQFRQRLIQHRSAPVSLRVRLLRSLGLPEREEGKRIAHPPEFGWLRQWLKTLQGSSWIAADTWQHHKAALVTLVVAATLVLFFADPFDWTRVSADELLTHADTYEFLNETSTAKVVRARVRIDRISLSTKAEKRIGEIETDKDSASDKVYVSTESASGVARKSVIDDRDKLSGVEVFDDDLSLPATNYLQKEGWFPQVTVSAYRKLISGRGFSGNDHAFVVRNGQNYELHHPFGPSHPSAITETSLQLNAQTYAPLAISIFTSEADGRFEYRLTRTSFELLERTQEVARLFEIVSPVDSNTTAGKSEIRNPKSETVRVSPGPVASSPVVASADLEVEVLRLLSEAQADLGEQISATRNADGLIHVNGIVDAPERKAEILHALRSLVDNPAVRIEIQTVGEAVARQQQQKSLAKATPGSITEQKVEINNEALPVASELRRHFSNDEEMRRFAARIVSDSRSAMRHVYAMKRLVGQFSLEQLRALTPEAKSKWRSLISSHARAYQGETQSLRQQLQPMFPASGGSAVTGSPGVSLASVDDDALLISAVDRLFALASSNDAIIWSAFATSSETASASAISSAQFWQSMKSAESLAASIVGQKRER
jgi:hypothetical protein